MALGLDKSLLTERAFDSVNPQLKEKNTMKVKLSPLGTVAYGALMTFLKPQLAMDSEIDLKRGLRTITAKNYRAKRPVLAAWIAESVKDKLDPQYAQDGALNSDGLDAVLDMIEIAADEFPEEFKEKMEEKKEEKGKDKAKDKAKDKKPMAGARDEDMEDEDSDMTSEDEDDDETEEEREARMKKRADDKKAKDKKAKDSKKAKDATVEEKSDEDETKEEEGEDEDMEEKERAMDAQIEAGIAAGIKKERQRMEGVATAKDYVRPSVGNLSMSFDSAADVYRKALTIVTGKEPPK